MQPNMHKHAHVIYLFILGLVALTEVKRKSAARRRFTVRGGGGGGLLFGHADNHKRVMLSLHDVAPNLLIFFISREEATEKNSRNNSRGYF